jgi:hypothetical protein
MKALKEFVFSIINLVLGLGFLALVVWEYSIGFAAGSYGGAGVGDNPGLFWFLIALQMMFGFYFISRFIKGIADIFSAHFQASSLSEDGRMKKLMAVYRVAQFAALFFLGILGIWAVIDLSLMFYSTVREMEIIERILLGVFAILSIGTFITLLFYLLLIPFLKDIYPEALSSAKFLIDEIETLKKRRKKTNDFRGRIKKI